MYVYIYMEKKIHYTFQLQRRVSENSSEEGYQVVNGGRKPFAPDQQRRPRRPSLHEDEVMKPIHFLLHYFSTKILLPYLFQAFPQRRFSTFLLHLDQTIQNTTTPPKTFFFPKTPYVPRTYLKAHAPAATTPAWRHPVTVAG